MSPKLLPLVPRPRLSLIRCCVGALLPKQFDRIGGGALMKKVPATYSACAFAVMVGLGGAAEAQDSGVEEIRVTGTRIVRSGVDTPVPVTMVSAAELNQIAPGTMIESLITLPQFYDNIAPDQITGGQTGGGANLNLRGAGVNRSLVLLDGRRVVPSNRFGTVDVSAFPEELISRVETVTGGASASYGTDAVAGVVNFILDTEFDGFKLHSQSRQHHGRGRRELRGRRRLRHGHRRTRAHHRLGRRLQRRCNRTFDALKDRGFYRQMARVTGPAGGPAEIIRPYVSPTNFTNGGIFIQPAVGTTPASALDHIEFLPDGSFRPLPFSGVGSIGRRLQLPGRGDAIADLRCGLRRANCARVRSRERLRALRLRHLRQPEPLRAGPVRQHREQRPAREHRASRHLARGDLSEQRVPAARRSRSR